MTAFIRSTIYNLIFLALFGLSGTIVRNAAAAQAINVKHAEGKQGHDTASAKKGETSSSDIAEQMVGQRKNMGSSINSQWDDIIPIISADGKTLYFDRKNYPLNTGGAVDYDDIWYSEALSDSTWSPAKNLTALNTKNPNAIFSILPDNNTALYWGAIDKETGQPAFALVHRTETGWTAPEIMHISDFYNDALTVTASLAADGKTLLMAVRRKDSQAYLTEGGMNIYVSFLEDEEKNEWSEPKNLGDIINTKFGETTPLLSADGVTLFFSSARPGGIGNIDIYMSRRLDSTWTSWSPPVDLGEGFNIPGENFMNSITASGEYAYLSGIVENPTKNMDIFRIRMPEKFRTHPVVLVKGRVFESKTVTVVNSKTKRKMQTTVADTTKPLSARIIYERLSDGKEMGRAHTDPGTGEYEIALPCGEKYGFRAERDGYLPVDDNLDLTDIESYQEIQRNIILARIEVGSDISLNNLFFDEGKADIRTESYAELDRIVGVLKNNPNISVEIDGHTDDVGSPDFNKALSLQRARAVVDYLIGKGIGDDRLVAKGLGMSQPVASNDTEEGKQKNRRVVFTIIREK